MQMVKSLTEIANTTMVNNIKGKKILLLCENFYGYDKAIRDELYKLGAKYVFLKNVKYFMGSYREPRNFKIQYLLKNPFERRCWTKAFEKEISDLYFDLFICIENACFVKSFMTFLHSKNPTIKTILFLWDTYKTQQGGFKDYRFLFDKVYSFDRDDALQYGLEYFPDFYIPQENHNKYLYDLSFVGTANDSSTIHRFELIDYVSKFCEINRLNAFLYLKTFKRTSTSNPLKILKRKLCGKLSLQQLCEKYANEKWLHFEPINLDECNKIQSQARVLLDLNHKDRQGMTINCITALAQGQKLITTNKRIKEESFYDPNMIYIMDDEKPYLDLVFWNLPCKPIDLSHLRIDNWLLYITK